MERRTGKVVDDARPSLVESATTTGADRVPHLTVPLRFDADFCFLTVLRALVRRLRDRWRPRMGEVGWLCARLEGPAPRALEMGARTGRLYDWDRPSWREDDCRRETSVDRFLVGGAGWGIGGGSGKEDASWSDDPSRSCAGVTSSSEKSALVLGDHWGLRAVGVSESSERSGEADEDSWARADVDVTTDGRGLRVGLDSTTGDGSSSATSWSSQL